MKTSASRRYATNRPGEVAIPLLTLLADIDRFEQVGARAVEILGRHRAEVGDGDVFLGRLREEEVPDWCVRGLGKALELLEGRLGLAARPGIEVRKARGERGNASSGALACPAQQLGFHLDANGHAAAPPETSAFGSPGLQIVRCPATMRWCPRQQCAV
ncbi:MAG: hypothetical protein V2A73_20415 [Pseudomonadota bacterium]